MKKSLILLSSFFIVSCAHPFKNASSKNPIRRFLASVNGEQVAAPTGLRRSVYDKKSGEIFWDRPETLGLSYEIGRNGSVVTTTTGISYFDKTLVAGTTYTFTVTAIDQNENRSTPVPIIINTASGDDSGPENPPSNGSVATPNGLRKEVYDKKSGEIFWDRPGNLGLTYEISKNGSVVRTTDGISHFDKTLVAGTNYTFTVTAIDKNSNRSNPASITFNTASGNDDNNSGEPVTPPGSETLAAPSGLIKKVYGKRSGEIFWDRPTTPPGLSYEISRDGAVVKSTDGVSFYDDTLSAGTTYAYAVTAMDLNGNRSTPALVTLTTTSEGNNNNNNDNDDDDDNGGSSDNYFATPISRDIIEPTDVFTRDGYSPYNVIRLNVRTVTTAGVCNTDDQSGCTLADVIADIDGNDDFKVDIPVHVSADDFPDDGSVSNAELRQRGGGSRNGAQKSFRIKFDSKTDIWRGERHFQLNKHPFESNRVRNKLAFDVMIGIPHLPSLRTQFVNLWIDDGNGLVDYGLFTHVERVNGNFLRNRGWDDDGNLYKAEDFRFDRNDLSNTRVDADGEPLNEDLFESSISIDNGKDHRPLQNMLQAINDPNRSFESVLSQYFDRANAMAWVATNILLHQADAVRHNYILYNPVGSEKFYFIPWDYDAAMGRWVEPPRDLSNDSLRQRTEYGYALAAGNVFLQGFYRMPGIHNEIIQAVNSLRENYVTDQLMTELTNTHFNLAGPFQQRLPDSEHNSGFSFSSASSRARAPRENAEALKNTFQIPMGPILQRPQRQGSEWLFSWSPAFDVTGTSGGFSYRLQVAQTPTFEAGTIVTDVDSIFNQADNIIQSVASSVLPSGRYYARVIARPANEPDRFFQVTNHKLFTNGTTYYGVIEFDTN